MKKKTKQNFKKVKKRKKKDIMILMQRLLATSWLNCFEATRWSVAFLRTLAILVAI
jgi:hypothetical protein